MYIGEEASFTYTMPANDVQLTANFAIISSRGELSGLQFKIYPNPASEYFVVSTSGNLESIQISDLTGRILHNQKLTGDNAYIYTKLEPGQYFLIIEASSGRYIEKILIK